MSGFYPSETGLPVFNQSVMPSHTPVPANYLIKIYLDYGEGVRGALAVAIFFIAVWGAAVLCYRGAKYLYLRRYGIVQPKRRI